MATIYDCKSTFLKTNVQMISFSQNMTNIFVGNCLQMSGCRRRQCLPWKNFFVYPNPIRHAPRLNISLRAIPHSLRKQRCGSHTYSESSLALRILIQFKPAPHTDCIYMYAICSYIYTVSNTHLTLPTILHE